MKSKFYKNYNNSGYDAWMNNEKRCHNLNGPAAIFHDTKPDWYYIDGRYYNNFLDYIKAVIKYKKKNK